MMFMDGIYLWIITQKKKKERERRNGENNTQMLTYMPQYSKTLNVLLLHKSNSPSSTMSIIKYILGHFLVLTLGLLINL